MGDSESRIIRLCRLDKCGFSLELQNENDTFSTVEIDAYRYVLAEKEYEGTGEFDIHKWWEVELIDEIDSFYVSHPKDFNKIFTFDFIQREFGLKDDGDIEMMDFKEWDRDVLGTGNLALEEATKKYYDFKASFEVATSKDDLKLIHRGEEKYSLACRQSTFTWEIPIDDLIYVITGYHFYLQEVIVQKTEGAWLEIGAWSEPENWFITSIDASGEPKYRIEVDGIMENEFSISTRKKETDIENKPTFTEVIIEEDYFDSFNIPSRTAEKMFNDFKISFINATKRDHLNIEIKEKKKKKKKNKKDELPGLSALLG